MYISRVANCAVHNPFPSLSLLTINYNWPKLPLNCYIFSTESVKYIRVMRPSTANFFLCSLKKDGGKLDLLKTGSLDKLNAMQDFFWVSHYGIYMSP